MMDKIMEKINGVDEVLERFILSVTEGYFDKKLYMNIMIMINDINKDIYSKEITGEQAMVLAGLLSAQLEYTIAMLETF